MSVSNMPALCTRHDVGLTAAMCSLEQYGVFPHREHRWVVEVPQTVHEPLAGWLGTESMEMERAISQALTPLTVI
jgi:hypothetical protein